MKKISMRSLVAIVAVCAMIVSTLCIGGLFATAESSLDIPLESFTRTNVVLDGSDPNNDGVARMIHIDAGSTSGDYTTNLWFHANSNKLGFEFGSGKNYKFWAVVKGDKLVNGNINFITQNNTGGSTTPVKTASMLLTDASGYNVNTWTKIESTDYITMDADSTQVKFQVWLNPGSTAKNIYIDSIAYAEYDAEAGEIIAGTEKEMDLSLLTVNSGKATVASVSDATFVTDVNNDSKKLKITVPALASGATNSDLSTTKANFTVVSGRKYQISFYMLSNAALYNANLPITGTVSDYDNAGWKMNATTGGVWKKYTNTFTAVDTDLSINFWFRSRAATATTLYIDDFAITDITDYTGFESTSTKVTIGINTNTNRAGDTDNSSIEITAAAATESAATSVTAEKTITGLEAGKLYSVSMWVKGEACDGGNIYFNAVNVNGERIKYETVTTKSTTEWTKITRDNVMADDDGSIAIGAWIKNGDTSATRTIWLDEINVSAQKTLDVQGASIKTETENQDLKFNMSLSTEGIVAEDWNVTEYGVIFVPQQRFGTKIPAGSELTLELAEEYSNYIIVSSQEADDGSLPETLSFTLNGSSSTPILNGGSSCGVKICARAYYKYSYKDDKLAVHEGVIYSDNDLDGTESNSGTQVENGIATRSVYGIARNMAAKIFENGFTPADTDLVQSYTDGKFYDAEGAQVTSANVLKFVVNNKSAVADIVK